MEIIQYGDPDNSGKDLKGYGQIYIRAEVYLCLLYTSKQKKQSCSRNIKWRQQRKAEEVKAVGVHGKL